MDLGHIDFTGANLSRTVLSGATLFGTNLEGVNATRANFLDTRFDEETNISGACFHVAVFQQKGVCAKMDDKPITRFDIEIRGATFDPR